MNDITTLFQTLESPDGTQRRHAALALGAVKDRAVAPELIARLRAETDPGVREDLTWAIVQHAADAQSELLAMLKSDDANDRRTGAHVLSKVGDPAHLEHLSGLVGDAHSDVAIKAYRAVANTKADGASEVLVARLGDGDHLQRDALTNAFHTLGEAAVPALVDALADGDAEVRAHAAEALGHMGEAAGGAADALEKLAADADAEVRLAAVSALGQLGEPAQPALARLADGADALVAKVAARFTAA